MKRRSLFGQGHRLWEQAWRPSRFRSPADLHALNEASNMTRPCAGSRGNSSVGATISDGGGNCSAHSERFCGNGNGTDVQRHRLFGTAVSGAPQTGIEKENVDCVVMGAGVVGLAVARELAMQGREVVVVEAAEGIGTGTSSRSSEVIHAGIYYPPGSLKAKTCVEGKQAMYAYCKERDIPHENAAKLIVATEVDQIPVLEKLASLGKTNAVNDLRMISGGEAMQMEPALKCVKALVSPSTGIVDSHAFMLALQTDAENLGVLFGFNAAVVRCSVTTKGIEIGVADASSFTNDPKTLATDVRESTVLSAKTVINATGLFAQSVSRRISGLPLETIPKAHYAKGCYFSLSGVTKPPFSRLIYPVPEEGGIGVHVTKDLGGQTRFGPDVEWLPHLSDDAMFPAQFDYVVDPRRGEKFYAEIRKYYPALADGSLQPDYSGMRPKLSGRGHPPADFLIQGERAHGIPGLIQLYGIESPGLTASLAIGKLVSKMAIE